MNHWTRRIFVGAAALLLTSCLWGPGKFVSDLTLKKDSTFVLDYKGEVVLQLPPDADDNVGAVGKRPLLPEWQDARRRWRHGGVRLASAKRAPVYRCGNRKLPESGSRQTRRGKRKESEDMAKMFGLPGLDDESNRAFAAKLMKYEGWRSVVYRGKGVFDVDYHFEGRATQDFMFPMLPDNDLLIPFIALRHRKDGSVLVTAPAMTGGSGPIAARAGQAAASSMKDGPVSRAQGRLTVITNGEILTNNSEDGASAHPLGRQVHWDVGPGSTKIPETLIKLQ